MAPNGFGPKSPCNDGAIFLADQEAATIGRLASYCINLGAIPAFPLRGFWWSRGRCLGMKAGDDLADIVKVIGYLRAHVGNVLNAEGVEPYLVAMEEVRSIGLGMFPNEDENWVTMEEAMDFTGRKKSIIYEWIKAGGVPVLDDRWGLMISKEHLRMKMAIVHANMLRRMNDINQNRRS